MHNNMITEKVRDVKIAMNININQKGQPKTLKIFRKGTSNTFFCVVFVVFLFLLELLKAVIAFLI